MAHVRKDTLTTPGEWAKHLRRRGKKTVSKSERQAAKKEKEKEAGYEEDYWHSELGCE